MKTVNLVNGILILLEHYDNPVGYYTYASHDEIYLQATDTPLTEEEVSMMLELGWMQDGFNLDLDSEYNPEADWYCYT